MNRTSILIGTALLLLSTAFVPAAAACPEDGGIVGEARCTAEDTANYAIITAVGATFAVINYVDSTVDLALDRLCGEDRSGCGVDEERERIEHLKKKLLPDMGTPS